MNRISVMVKRVDGQEERLKLIDRYPDMCPLCHTSMSPKPLVGIADNLEHTYVLDYAFQCTKHGCSRMFIGTYSISKYDLNACDLVEVSPVRPRDVEFSQHIAELSPAFVEVYSQAIASEGYRLHQLTGIGLRKAIEFLIKDFAIKNHPEKKGEIVGMNLAQCISQYVADIRIKECVKRAAWLGNDETHYERRWLNKDIEDLKILIRLAVNWIESDLLTKEYIAEMPDPKG